jgi:hypothetical protein
LDSGRRRNALIAMNWRRGFLDNNRRLFKATGSANFGPLWTWEIAAVLQNPNYGGQRKSHLKSQVLILGFEFR